MRRYEGHRAHCGGPPEFVMEGEVAIPVSVRERVIGAGNTMFPFSPAAFTPTEHPKLSGICRLTSFF